jgi:hypothetical protein
VRVLEIWVAVPGIEAPFVGFREHESRGLANLILFLGLICAKIGRILPSFCLRFSIACFDLLDVAVVY